MAALTWVALIALVANVGCDGGAPVVDRPVALDAADLAQSSNAFAWDLHAQLAAEADGNVFVSPSIVHVSLTMALAGARETTAYQLYNALQLPWIRWCEHESWQEGETFHVKQTLMGARWDAARLARGYASLLNALVDEDAPAHELHIANALWGQADYSWREEFIETLETYGASLRQVDFATDADAAGQDANAWIAEQTRGKITDVIPAGGLDPLTRLILAGAVYFKADWAKPFDVQVTGPGAFQLSPERLIWVRMMEQVESFEYAETDLVRILRMPYRNDAASMIVFLPKAVDGLPDVEAWLAQDGPDGVLENLALQRVKLVLPQFEFRWQSRLNRPLAAMGITDAFDAKDADFTGMSSQAADTHLHISSVLPAAYVDVDEKGREAAAVAPLIARECETDDDQPTAPLLFRVDRPFAFAIRHEATGLLLFVGRVTDPDPGQTPIDGRLLPDGSAIRLPPEGMSPGDTP
jgi:serpin B